MHLGVVGLLAALIAAFFSSMCLLFLAPLFHRVSHTISVCAFVAVGVVLGSLLIIWPSMMFRGLNDGAIKTAGGIIGLALPYGVVGGVSALVAWSALRA